LSAAATSLSSSCTMGKKERGRERGEERRGTHVSLCVIAGCLVCGSVVVLTSTLRPLSSTPAAGDVAGAANVVEVWWWLLRDCQTRLMSSETSLRVAEWEEEEEEGVGVRSEGESAEWGVGRRAKRVRRV
jgi:hypothetical protein